MVCAWRWSISGSRRSSFPVVSLITWLRWCLPHLSFIKGHFPPFMISRQSVGWRFGTSCFPTASPVGLASTGDLCLKHVLHWCLKNGYFLVLFLHLLAGILSRVSLFSPFPPFLCFVFVVVELWTHAFIFICCVIINESFYLMFRTTTSYVFLTCLHHSLCASCFVALQDALGSLVFSPP